MDLSGTGKGSREKKGSLNTGLPIWLLVTLEKGARVVWVGATQWLGSREGARGELDEELENR